MALTPEQIAAYRQKYGLDDATTSAAPASAEDRIAALRQAAEPTVQVGGVDIPAAPPAPTKQPLTGVGAVKQLGKGAAKAVGSIARDEIGSAAADLPLVGGGPMGAKLAGQDPQAVADETKAGLKELLPEESTVPQGWGEKIGFYGTQLASLLTPFGVGAKIKKAIDAPRKAVEFATDFVKPKVTAKVEQAALQKGSAGVQEAGIFSKATIQPSARDQRAAQAIARVIDPKKSTVQNIDAINAEVSRINDGVKGFIRANKAPFNEKQLRKKLNDAKEDLRIVFASDPTVERTYDAVVDELVRNVGNKDTYGLFEARQSFDKIPAVKKLLDTMKPGQGENVRREVVLAVRRAANEYIADLLPKGNKYRADLLREADLLYARENAAAKAAGTVGKSKVGKFIEDHPRAIKAAGVGAGLAGAGALGAGGISILRD